MSDALFSYECFKCHRMFAFVSEEKCPSCGGTNGQKVSKDRLVEGIEVGLYRNPKKPKKRR